MSAQSFLATPGNGGNTTFSIDTFSQDEIKVYVNEVLKQEGSGNDYQISNYTATGGRIDWVGTAPTSNDRIRIVRQTKILNNGGNAVEGKATYSAGAAVKATDLNNNTKQVLRSLQEHNDQLIQTYDIQADAITSAKIADDQINSEHYVDGSIDHQHLSNDCIDGDNIQDDVINSEHYAAGSIDEEHLSNSSITANKIADGTVGTLELANGAVTEAKIANDSINSQHYVDGSIDTAHLSSAAVTGGKIADNTIATQKLTDNVITTAKISNGAVTTPKIAADAVTGDKIADDSVNSEHIAAGALDNEHYADGSITSDKLNGATVITSSEQGSATTNDTSFLTSAAADARFFNISSGDTIKDGQTFPDNDTTIATTAAINDRIIDIVNDVGGFDIVESEQHFPNTNPQGQAGSAAVLSIKAASTNLVPSGTTLTITNGNLADNANITITGVTSTIPSGFGFIVESTATLHTYTFHRLVPKATEVTTVAGKATEIGRLGTAAAVEDMSILGTADAVADMAILGTNDVVADMNLLATSDVISDMNTLAVANVLSDLSTVADSVTNVNNVGNNITNVNSVSNSAGANQTFTVTVQNVSGNKYFIDGVQTPVLKLARGKTYTFDMSDSSNSTHPLAFRDSSDNSYTTGVTTSGTAGSSGATVVIVVAANAPSSLKYYCTSHGNAMGNTITVIDDNVGTVAGSISNVNTVGGAISNVNTTAGSIANVNTVATNINDINDFTDKYRVGANNPTTSLDTGDLFFNTTSNSLKVYTGSAWVDGVTAAGNFAVVTGNTFTGSNRYNDNAKAEFGTGADLSIYHDGANSYIIDSGVGQFYIRGGAGLHLENPTGSEKYIRCVQNGTVELYYDNSKKLETMSTGVDVHGTLRADELKLQGDNQILKIGGADDLQLYHSGQNSIINNNVGDLRLESDVIELLNHDSNEFYLRASNGGGVELYHNAVKKFETTSTGVQVTGVLDVGSVQLNGDGLQMGDADKVKLGAGNDLQVYHDGSHSYLEDAGTGELRLKSNLIRFQGANGEALGVFEQDSATALYFDNSIKLNTNAVGVRFVGNLRGIDNEKIQLGASQDLQLYHDGTNSFIENSTGQVRLKSYQFFLQSADGSENFLKATHNYGVELYYDNVKKLETTSGGVEVTGNIIPDANNTRNIGDGTTNFNSIWASNRFRGNDNVSLQLGNSIDFKIRHDGTDNLIEAPTGMDLKIMTGTGDNANETCAIFKNNGAVELYHNNSKKFETRSDGVAAFGDVICDSDSSKFKAGLSGDLTMYHNGSHSFIDNLTGTLYLRTPTNLSFATNTNEDAILCMTNGAVSLYYDNSKKFETNSGGAEVFGHLKLDDSKYLKLGNSGGTQDVAIYHNGYNFHVQHTNAGSAYIDSVGDHNFRASSGNEYRAAFKNNGAVDLYYDGSKKFETTSSGATVSGALTSTGLTVNGGTSPVTIDHTGGNALNLTRSNKSLTFNANYGAADTHAAINITSGMELRFQISGSDRIKMTASGHWIPTTNNARDLGSSSYRWANIYTNDLSLSNEGSSNDVDGTWGDWTIQEGESDLFLKNNRSGKKYKFNLTEVS